MNTPIYKIINQINFGGMAEIFLGVAYNDFGFDQIVTIKRLNEKYKHDSLAQDLFMREANILRKLNHVNVSNFIGFAEINGQRSMVIGFVHGRNARDLLEFSKKLKMNVSVSMAVHIATEVARGLHYCHNFKDPGSNNDLHIIHSDISPENILISYEGEVKIIDFGVAQVPGVEGFEDDGKLKGKIRYMSPEFIKTARGTPASDIYSLGMVLYELLVGGDLFVGQSMEEIFEKKLSPPSPSDLMAKNEQVDEELAKLVLRCIQPDTNNRYSSALDLERDLSLYFHRRDPEYMPRKLGNFLKQVFTKEHKRIESIIQESVILKKDLPVADSLVIGDRETALPKSIDEILKLFKNEEADLPIIHRGKTLELEHTDSTIRLARTPPGMPVAVRTSQKPSLPVSHSAPRPAQSFTPVASVHTRTSRQHAKNLRKSRSAAGPSPVNSSLQFLIVISIIALAFFYFRTHPMVLAKIKQLVGI